MTDSASLDFTAVLGEKEAAAIERARAFLDGRSTSQLLGLVGETVPELALATAPDKRAFPAAYGGGKPCGEDLLAGRGAFYVNQDGGVMLDCTGGHYQMTWGYSHPALTAAAMEGMRRGLVWDNHSNTPGIPVKQLANELVAAAKGTGVDRVLLGVCTGSVACSSALKIILASYRSDPARMAAGPPIVVTLSGNYHGTDLVAQTMRGMWPGLVCGLETVCVEPNDADALRSVFAEHGPRVAGFWAEPVMMNREAILVEREYLRLARDLCREHGALMVLDEIQTCFWYPEVLLSVRLGLDPDMIVVGKGMTAGFHPLAALLYRRELDVLEQYDAISTNGNASLAAFLGLCNLRLIAGARDELARLGARYRSGLEDLTREFPGVLERLNGHGYLAGLKFRDRADALGFHRAALDAGLWLRAHAYHPGHRTVLTKFALCVDQAIVDYVLDAMRRLLSETPWR